MLICKTIIIILLFSIFILCLFNRYLSSTLKTTEEKLKNSERNNDYLESMKKNFELTEEIQIGLAKEIQKADNNIGSYVQEKAINVSSEENRDYSFCIHYMGRSAVWIDEDWSGDEMSRLNIKEPEVMLRKLGIACIVFSDWLKSRGDI